MITANQWYNIAQTAQVGTKSGIRIDFGTKYALFKVSVDYGNAVIAAVESNITAEETRLSVRIRYNNSAWFVDVRFSVSQETTLSAATYDNTGWEAVNPNTSVAGNTICIINDLTSLIRPSGGGESLFELINVGTAEVPRFAVVPKKYNGVEVGIISNTFISMAGFEEPDDDTPVASSSLGDLLDVQITDPKSKDVLTYDEDLRKWVNGPGGLDETALGNYLTTNKYITQDALTGALNGYVTNEIYNTAITALNLRLTELETAFKEWFYYDDVNKAIRTKLSLIVDGTLSMGELGSGGGTEVASGKLVDLLDVQITDPASGQILLYNEEKGLWVNGSAGLNEEQLEAYLKGKDYATNSALSSLQTSVNTLRTDFDNLNSLLNGNVGGVIDTWNEVVSFLDGYSQSDDLATILSGMNSDITNRVLIEDFKKLEGSVTDISNRVKTFEDVIGIDSNGDVYIKGTRNFYTEGGTISMFGLGEGDSGEVASVSIKFEGSDDVYSAVEGIITLPAYPSGGGVADSVDWANVENKPTTLGGYGITDALSESGGFISSSGWRNQLNILRAEAADSVIGFFNQNIDNYLGAIGFDNDTNLIVNIKNIGNANILHSGNYGSYALPLSGGTITGTLRLGNPDVLYNGANTTFFRNASPTADYGTQIVNNWNGGSTRILLNSNGIHYWDVNGNVYPLIHSGNIDSYAVKYAGGASVDAARHSIGYDNSSQGSQNLPTSGGFISADQGAYGFQLLGMPTGSKLFFRGIYNNSLSDWKTIAFTDSNVASANYATNADTLDGYHAVTNGHLGNIIPVIGGDGVMEIGAYIDMHHDNSTVNYDFSVRVSCPSVSGVNVVLPSTSGTLALLTDNVASATKLQTARYIFGQLFDGTQTVSGVLSDVNQVTFDANKTYGIFRGDWYSSVLTRDDLVFYAPRSVFSDYVLIGTTSGIGHSYGKLQVYESSNEWGSIIYTNKSAVLSAHIGGYGLLVTSSNYNNGTYLLSVKYNDSYLTGNGDSALYIKDNGNVLIGTTEDNGHKLQVNGSITTTEWMYGAENCGMYITNSGVYYSNHNSYANIESAGNEICIGGNTGDSIYVNYRVPRHYNIAPTAWVWCAGSSDSRATFFIGELRSYGIRASGDVVITGTLAMGTLSSSSDARLKDNIELLTEDESLAVLRRLRPSKWNWKSNGALSYGFIAQEVESIASCMVDRMNDEELGQKLYLQYNQLHAFEVGAIQHIDNEVEQLKKDLKTANTKIEILENELKQYRLCQ